MKEILGKAKTVRELLSDTKYSIDYYQREYKWQEKQIRELINDLASKFLEDYQPEHPPEEVEQYGHYFLGAIIISRKEAKNFIVDGQQRLTSLTLLLIYLHNLQRNRNDAVNIESLIVSIRHRRKSFNIDVSERNPCIEALFENHPFDINAQPESVQNIVARYEDIKDYFPEELTGDTLPFFLDWLLENVHLVEITAYSDADAYTIFETMNDRGLSLRPTEMLKGFLLANITDPQKKTLANDLWKKRIGDLLDLGKEIDADCLKTWFRSQYANSIRERKRGAKPQEFDRIGTEFHRWVRDSQEQLGLISSENFFRFVQRDFEFYSRHYLRLLEASNSICPGLEHVYFNAQLGFTTQYQLLLAVLSPQDSSKHVDLKLRLVGIYLDILLNRRLWNFKLITYNTMQYAMFLVIREVRQKNPEELAALLYEKLESDSDTVPPFINNDRLRLHQQNYRAIHRILARITDYIETKSGMPSRYEEYLMAEGNAKYEVEHIWANKPERFIAEFPSSADFFEYRNRLGGLLLLPKSFNASYGDRPYEEKLKQYNSQNLLARSLHPDCYEYNPGFQHLIKSGLSFQAHKSFAKADLDIRQDLYRQLAEQIWNPKKLLEEIQGSEVTI